MKIKFALWLVVIGTATVQAAAQNFRATFVLQPPQVLQPPETLNAPRNARGQGTLRLLIRDDLRSSLRIQTRGLVPGDFTLIGAGTGGPVFTRTITVGANGRSRDIIVFESEELLDPASVTSLSVVSNDIPLLMADLNQAGRSTAFLRSDIPITASDPTANVGGFAIWRRLIRNGQSLDRITVHASGLPARSTFMLLANGTEIGPVFSTSQGRVSVSQNAPEVAGFGRVQLMDSFGTEALSADF